MVVEEALGSRNLGSVSTLDGYVAHDGDQDVFLDVERTRVQAEGLAEDLEPIRRKDERQSFAQGKGNELSNDAGDVHGWVWINIRDERVARRGGNLQRELKNWLRPGMMMAKIEPRNQLQIM